MKKFFSLRMISYAFMVLLVVLANANAMAEPVMAGVDYVLSRRQSVMATKGLWETAKFDSPVRSIHAALLRTGKVLLIAGSGNDEKQFDAKTFRSVLWDPITNEFKDVPTPWDAFCSGHVFLPDGRLLVAGGTKEYEDLELVPKQEYQGLKDSYIFDPITESYEKVDNLDFARWYPTLVGLPDGKVLAASGLDENGKLLDGQVEIFDPATKQWEHKPELTRYLPTYPSLLLTNDGRLFYSGSNAGYGSTETGRTPGFWNLSDNTFVEVPGLSSPELMETSATVMLPPAQDQRVMVMGGGGVGDSPISSDRTAIIDLDAANPHFVDGPKLKEATRYPNAVILPDGTVLEAGGSAAYRDEDVHTAMIFDPKTNAFKEVASPRVGRNYHTEALLLPDGRVAVFGSNPIDNSFEMRIEIYSPAYMFNGTRPEVIGGKRQLERGVLNSLKTSDPTQITNVRLVRPSSVTHVTDVEQRSIDLDFVRDVDGISVTAPTSANLAPGGWYMLFVTNQNNIPSQAYWVHL